MENQHSVCTFLVLLYGDYLELHRRCLETLRKTTPAGTPIRVGLNAVGNSTQEYLRLHEARRLDDLRSQSGDEVYYSSKNENLLKYPMMRLMLQPAVQTPWVVWLDDDTWFDKPGWYAELEAVLLSGVAEYVGEVWFVHYLPGQREFVSSRPWYSGKPFELIRGRPGVRFCTGGFVAIKTSVLHELGWPDPALRHNGGDTLLGEAIRQCGYRRAHLSTKQIGIRVNDAKRRGYHERPAGSTLDIRR